MSETNKPGRRGRRSRAEAIALAAKFEASGVGREQFCAEHEIGLATLDRYRKCHAQAKAGENGQWLAVELSEPTRTTHLTVVLAGGRQVEVNRGFDPGTLEKVVRLLERT